MFLHQFINSDFYKLLNSQLFAACIGAFVTIAGVWLTIYNDRKSRRVERKNEIKPVYSISFMGIEDEIELEKGIKYFINKNTFSYMPIDMTSEISALISGVISKRLIENV